jgi:heat-inducible transcriptional repressor
MSFDLNQRHQQILWATIRQYISTAEPVGSKTLVDGYNLNISPATIRSGFATLEKAGFLYQPHTSAGRIPSDSGYRLYVDRSIQPSQDIGLKVEALLASKLNLAGWSVEAILRGAVEVLATLSGYITMITLPQTRRSVIKHIQLVRVETHKLMVIVVWDAYETQSILMQIPTDQHDSGSGDILDRELQTLSNFLNSKLRDKSVLEIANLDWSELLNVVSPVANQQFDRYHQLINTLLADLSRQSRLTYSSPQMIIWGIADFLCQPEFSELQQVQALLHLLESEQNKIWELIFDPNLNNDLIGVNSHFDHAHQKPTIRIGIENPFKQMQACTLISTNYHQDSIPVGSVGILGPKRMLYENAIALVQSTANYLSTAISQESGT